MTDYWEVCEVEEMTQEEIDLEFGAGVNHPCELGQV